MPRCSTSYAAPRAHADGADGGGRDGWSSVGGGMNVRPGRKGWNCEFGERISGNLLYE